MYGTTHDGEDWPDGADTRTRPASPRRAASRLHEARRLSALRREIRDEAITACAGKRIIIDLYALGIEPMHSHQRAQLHAESEGFTVGKRFYDPHGTADPTQRPGWSKMCARIAGGFAQGIIVVGQSDISTDPDEVEIILRWLEAHCAFVDFVLAPLSASPTTGL
ncbi:recombinase family protein [Streptomyces violascens]|uniref:recombinase family protein n=1 Tax=Streptomyces violascens TaxID=67381 RepID=UPI00378B466C